MSNKIIALYDTTEIQKYIYSSNKLKDNIGASNLVEKCFSNILIKSICEICKENFKTDWKKNKNWEFRDTDKYKGEVVYIGGGNAVVAFDSTELWKEVNYAFSKKLILEAPGLKFVTVCKKITNDFCEDITELFRMMKEKKYDYNSFELTNGLCITRECNVTKKPAFSRLDDQNVSYEVYKKRLAVENDDNSMVFIDDIGGRKGESYIATVHIDGNSMGEKIQSIISSNEGKKYDTGIPKIRQFSEFIQNAYEEAYNSMMKKFANIIYNDESISNNSLIKDYRKIFKDRLPFRKILIKGDDITYICYGKLAISSVEVYFDELKEILSKNAETKDLTACCGIAFSKPHYPFSASYVVAEECCASAKERAKEEAKKNCKSRIGYYLDFHIIRGSLLNNLQQLREEQFNVSYKDIEEKEKKYNLLLRPFDMEKNNELFEFDKIKSLIKDLKKIPRSRIKELRDAFIYSEEELQDVYNIMKSRGYILRFNEKEDLFIKEQTPYFDAIDFMELYDDLFLLK